MIDLCHDCNELSQSDSDSDSEDNNEDHFCVCTEKEPSIRPPKI